MKILLTFLNIMFFTQVLHAKMKAEVLYFPRKWIWESLVKYSEMTGLMVAMNKEDGIIKSRKLDSTEDYNFYFGDDKHAYSSNAQFYFKIKSLMSSEYSTDEEIAEMKEDLAYGDFPGVVLYYNFIEEGLFDRDRPNDWTSVPQSRITIREEVFFYFLRRQLELRALYDQPPILE